MIDTAYGAAIVGTGFASAFFLLEYLKHAGPNDRILVLERGKRYDTAWKLHNRTNSPVESSTLFVNRTPDKLWVQNIAFGGGACWTGNMPRFHPNDFRTKSLYGVGTDWPLTYDELEPYYTRVEETMGTAGGDPGPYPRAKPYPSPPHALNAVDKILVKKFPGQYIPLPTARSSTAATKRPPCCGNGICATCPIMAKFQVDLHLSHLYQDPRVTLLLEAEVDRLEIQGDRVVGVHYRQGGKDAYARCDLAVVGAHAIVNPFIMLRSGLKDPALGRYLNEQISISVQTDLDGLDNFDGGTAVTGLGLMFLDGPFRSTSPGCLVENWNVPWLRAERGRWRQRAFIKFVFEDLPSAENYVGLASADARRPAVYYPRHSAYMAKGLASVPQLMQTLAKHLPIEDYEILPIKGLGGSAHIQGTTRMGNDPKTSVIDRTLRHHRVRNLLSLGSGVYPTCPAGNPTLTLSALSMWAAERLFH